MFAHIHTHIASSPVTPKASRKFATWSDRSVIHLLQTKLDAIVCMNVCTSMCVLFIHILHIKSRCAFLTGDAERVKKASHVVRTLGHTSTTNTTVSRLCSAVVV